jgi:ribosome-interacting GTPase 1
MQRTSTAAMCLLLLLLLLTLVTAAVAAAAGAGIIEGAKDGKGRGRQVISTARTCNLILIVLDCLKPLTHKKLIEHELEGFGIRLNKKPPNITFKKKDKGGINFTTMAANPKLDLEAVKAVCAEYRWVGASTDHHAPALVRRLDTDHLFGQCWQVC